MSNKKLIYLSTVFVIIVALIIIGNQLGNKKPSEKELKFFPGVTEQAIKTINIREGNNAVTVRRKGDVWVVSKSAATRREGESVSSDKSPVGITDTEKKAGGEDTLKDKPPVAEYPVDSASIASALEKLVSMKKDALISTNPEKQSIFEVDTGKGIIVEVADNSDKQIGTIIIGKTGADWNSNYIRSKGSNSVYMVRGGVRYAFFTELNRWRDKSILKFDKSSVSRITLAKRDSGTITIVKADTGNPWKIIEPIEHPAKTEEVDGIVDKLASLNAADFQDDPLPDSATSLNNPLLGVTVTFKSGSSRSVIFGKKNSDNKCYVKTDGKDQVFLVYEYNFNQINKKLDDLKGEPLVKPIDADSTKKDDKESKEPKKSGKKKKSK